MKKTCIAIILLTALSSCSKHNSAARKQLNPEILGKWQDGFGCNLELSLSNNQLTLLDFTSPKGVHLVNQPLKWSKESVFTNFTTLESEPVLSGSFSDGLILVGNSLCRQALHKANSV